MDRPDTGDASGAPEDLTEAVFHEALRMPRDSREAFLSLRLPDDSGLRRMIRELLAQHDEADDPGALLLTTSAFERSTASRDSRPSEITSTKARYRLIEVLGEGGMAVVFLADQLEPVRRRVALKVVKLGSQAREDVARFSSEIQALALMNHPNIARVYEAGMTADGRLFFAMEYVAGRRLIDYCDDSRLSVRERLELFVTVCHAVQHAHQNGIIHRDLKPSNVLVQTDGPWAAPKLIDFGLAKFVNRVRGEQSIVTQKGLLIGSLEYMSPEQARPEQFEVDTRTDIYSLGVVLHELLTGVRPAPAPGEDTSPFQGLERIWRGEECMLASRRVSALGDNAVEHARRRGTDSTGLVRQLGGDLDWIVAKSIDFDRVRRYASASELAGELERHLRNEPVLAGPQSARYRLAKLARRHRGLIAATGLTILSLLIGLITSTGLYLENRRARRQLEEQRVHVQLSADAYQLEHLIQQADQIVPGLPEQIPELQAWIRMAVTGVLDRLPGHRERLAQLRRQDASATGVTLKVQDQLDREILAELVPKLERFASPTGALGQVRERLAFAGRVRAASIDSKRREWAAAIASIADRRRCPAYQGLRIRPQLGLVPIGRDPESGLWEFAHLQSGQAAVRDAAGRLGMTASTGIVLVLLPAGRYFMGATSDRRGLPAGAENFDPHARTDESPVHEVSLDAFFVSKFEMTQGQWIRLMHENHSECASGTRLPNMSYVHSLTHPVERVNHIEATRAASLLGLALPTEEQWEYAARAGSMSPAYWGEPQTMQGYANGADLASRQWRRRDWEYAPWNDGFAQSAPVGSFRPNRFGLHDVQGNVGEWCREEYAPDSYATPIIDREGKRAVSEASDYPKFVARGDTWEMNFKRARISWRMSLPAFNEERLGLRPVRRLDR